MDLLSPRRTCSNGKAFVSALNCVPRREPERGLHPWRGKRKHPILAEYASGKPMLERAKACLTGEDDPFAVELRGGLLMDHTFRL